MAQYTERECPKHGLTIHRQRRRGSWRCKSCAIDAQRKRRQKNKERLVNYFGGKCIKCGYAKSISALCFHHRDPEEKEFGLNQKSGLSLERLIKEAEKCDLLCSNCHYEEHDKIRQVAQSGSSSRLKPLVVVGSNPTLSANF